MRAETLTRLVAGFLVANAACLTIAAYSPRSSVVDLGDYGVIGDASNPGAAAANNAAFQAAFNNVANGGKLHLPCGVYKLTQQPAVTLSPGAHVEFVGDGAECAVIYMSGAVGGPAFTLASQWSSVRVADMSIVTDSVNTQSGLTFTGSAVITDNARSLPNSIENVNFRGNDLAGANTQYWSAGFYETNVSNISIVNLYYQGIAANNGVGISLHGVTNSYSVQINIANTNIDHCGNAITYGDWVQGVQVVNSNLTGCVNGVVVAASPAGGLSGLLVSNSQIAATACGLCVNDAAFANAQFANNQLIIFTGATGIKVQGSNFAVTGNEVNSTTTGSGTGIQVATTSGNGGIISGNHIAGFGNAIQVTAASQALLKIDSNLFSANTNDFLIASGASAVEIDDSHPRTFAQAPPCNNAIKASKFDVLDSQVNTFNTTLTSSNTGGAGNNYVGMKCDGTRYYVD